MMKLRSKIAVENSNEDFLSIRINKYKRKKNNIHTWNFRSVAIISTAFFSRKHSTRANEFVVGQFKNSPRRFACIIACPGLVNTQGQSAVPLSEIPR